VSTLRAADLRSALGLIHALERREASASFTAELLETLRGVIRSDLLSYHEQRRHASVGVRVPEALPRERTGLPCHLNPLFRYICARPDAARLSDFLPRKALHRQPFYDAQLRPLKLEYQLAVGFRASSIGSGVILFERVDGRDFSERDRQLLGLLRPHFVERCRRVERERRIAQLERALRDSSNGAAAPSRSNGVGGELTPREEEIIAWVGRGLTNKEIGTRLAISPETVRKHLENAYTKLGVHTRTAAVRARSHP
jgi:DNA-binding CsgD family transcriptional regulator